MAFLRADLTIRRPWLCRDRSGGSHPGYRAHRPRSPSRHSPSDRSTNATGDPIGWRGSSSSAGAPRAAGRTDDQSHRPV